MESPIDPRVPQLAMKAALGIFTGMTLFSVYYQRYRILSSTDDLLRKINRSTSEEEKQNYVEQLCNRLHLDPETKSFTRMALERQGKELLQLAVLKEDGSNAGTVGCAAKIITLIFANNPENKRRMAHLNGPRKLITSLSTAYALGCEDCLGQLTEALQKLTEFDEEAVVLQHDVPLGAECALALAQLPSIVNMLSILDPEGSPELLHKMVYLLANICMLNKGALTISKGCHGRSGISFFYQLLDHSDLAVVTKALRAIKHLCRAKCGRKEIASLKNVERIASNFAPNSDEALISSVLLIIMMMSGDEENGDEFFTSLSQTSILRTLFDIWVSSSNVESRRKAEMVACLCLQVKETAQQASQLLQVYRRAIIECQQKEEEAERKRKQELQQQQFMQRMMMEEMGMGMRM